MNRLITSLKIQLQLKIAMSLFRMFVLLFPVMMIGQVHDFEPVYGTSEFIGDTLVVIDGDTGRIGERLTPISEGYVVCEKQRGSLLVERSDLAIKLVYKHEQSNNRLDAFEYLRYKEYLIENGTCKITPEETVQVIPDCHPCLKYETKTIPADTSWIYNKPTFEGFMEWKIKNLIDE